MVTVSQVLVAVLGSHGASSFYSVPLPWKKNPVSSMKQQTIIT